jgi:hypothetical protein
LGKHSSDIWNLVPICLLWTVWREPNRRMFEDLESSRTQFLALFSSTLFHWSCVWGFLDRKIIAEFIVFIPMYIILFFVFGIL